MDGLGDVSCLFVVLAQGLGVLGLLDPRPAGRQPLVEFVELGRRVLPCLDQILDGLDGGAPLPIPHQGRDPLGLLGQVLPVLGHVAVHALLERQEVRVLHGRRQGTQVVLKHAVFEVLDGADGLLHLPGPRQAFDCRERLSGLPPRLVPLFVLGLALLGVRL
ncbi:hypothetical protein DSECCO2_560510 [anaerobic digester metagenome]